MINPKQTLEDSPTQDLVTELINRFELTNGIEFVDSNDLFKLRQYLSSE